MFCLQRPEKLRKEDEPLLANGHANGDCQTTEKKLLNGHANGKLMANGSSSAKSSNGYSSSNSNGYKNGAVLANGVNGHTTELTQRKVK